MNSRRRSQLVVGFYCCIPWLVLGIGSAALAMGLNHVQEHKLVLPKYYQAHLPSLQQAAQLAIQTPRCQELLQGSLHIDRSTPQHPVFRILCRDQGGNSFAFLIDGISLHLLDDTRPGGSISFSDLYQEQNTTANH
jgi:hypothetical protein